MTRAVPTSIERLFAAAAAAAAAAAIIVRITAATTAAAVVLQPGCRPTLLHVDWQGFAREC
jgi:hypothetical protein